MVLVRIYRIENCINDLIFIGATIQALNKRMWEHIIDASVGRQSTLYCKMRQLGYDNFSITLIKEIECIDLDVARFEEQEVINTHDRTILLNDDIE
jgi:GIY-YIG catalytic domain